MRLRSVAVGGAVLLLAFLTVALMSPGAMTTAAKDEGAPTIGPRAQSGPLAAASWPDLSSGGQAAEDDTAGTAPPIPGEGGTCISGFIIDRYGQPRGRGWAVTITTTEGRTKTVEATSTGEFRFDSLEAGTYVVELMMPEDGWQPFTLPTFPVTLSGVGSGCAEVRFQAEALPCLVVTKLDAVGRAGSEDMAGLPGWRITATYSSTTETLVTDGTGVVRFEGLVPATWIVTEEDKVGWRPAEGHDYQHAVQLESPREPGDCQALTFVNEQVFDGCIQVQVLDAFGEALEGWKTTIKRDDGTQASISARTTALGLVTFDELALGDWTISQEERVWWRPLGEAQKSVSLVEPGRCETQSFENEPLACIDGYTINHLGQGLEAWVVTATNAYLDEDYTAATDSEGYFAFRDLSLSTTSGPWRLAQGRQVDWQPLTAEEFEVNLTDPFECTHVRFKSKADHACLDVFQVDSADGVGLPGWEISLKPGYGGEARQALTDGTGHVRFDELTPGTYVVSARAEDGWSAVSKVERWVVLEATGSCAVVTFKSRQAGTAQAKAPRSRAGGAPCETGCRWYRVRPGDSLSRIAWRYGTSVSRLARANKLRNPNLIFVGQRICVPRRTCRGRG